ncbi:NADP-dependent oxidoreductase [Myroides sp. M-43]|uniref:NADP-dependent oxidoreductase n=1 Tax=Myroides oncorhynchi TaxID=2893756 RepID=UPI001E35FFAC|nr:NADP-dependent oxidoreductase [Myroides oncorhynchi]MCC9042989.1 NADP-dependent oxidoreductase [Myroides oncorhynchi]
MKAIVLNQAGSVDNLILTEVALPTIKSNEVLVQVKAIGINPVDVKSRAYEGVKQWIFGKKDAVILGWDIAGVVIELGSEVTKFKIGDKVSGMINFFGVGDGYAEYVGAYATHLSLVPPNVTLKEGAAIAMVGSTAYQALVDVAKVKQGDKVLVHAASGGVGHIAVQIAKAKGAHVIGTSSAKNKAFVMSLGADEHIDYTSEQLVDKVEAVDVVIDTIQGDTLLESIKVVKQGGMIVTLPSPEISEEVLALAKECEVSIVFMMVESKEVTVEAVAQLMSEGLVKVHINEEFSFEDMAKAHLTVETNRVVGKVVVTL